MCRGFTNVVVVSLKWQYVWCQPWWAVPKGKDYCNGIVIVNQLNDMATAGYNRGQLLLASSYPLWTEWSKFITQFSAILKRLLLQTVTQLEGYYLGHCFNCHRFVIKYAVFCCSFPSYATSRIGRDKQTDSSSKSTLEYTAQYAIWWYHTNVAHLLKFASFPSDIILNM